MHRLMALVFAVLFLGYSTTAQAQSSPKIEAQMPKEWLACNSANDCSIVPYNCAEALAVNTKYLSEARKLVYQIEHDPATVNCAPSPTHGRMKPPGPPVYMKTCSNNQCQAAPGE